MFPGYVLLNMVMNDDTWYVVRNTRGVTGFVGPGSKPVPLTEEEMFSSGHSARTTLPVDFAVGDMVIPSQYRCAGKIRSVSSSLSTTANRSSPSTSNCSAVKHRWRLRFAEVEKAVNCVFLRPKSCNS